MQLHAHIDLGFGHHWCMLLCRRSQYIRKMAALIAGDNDTRQSGETIVTVMITCGRH
jgi:hypothetical protein